jgi:hypothetical protein
VRALAQDVEIPAAHGGRKKARWLRSTFLLSVALVIGLAASFIFGHKAWPWTVTTSHLDAFRGIHVASTKEEVIEQVGAATQHGLAGQLWLIDNEIGGEIPLKASRPLSSDEAGYVSRIDRWRLDWPAQCVC